MANSFKTLLPEDVATTRTLLHEAIPITGTIVSGTYSDNNIKYFAHGMFEAVYDYPYLSSSANHIFDVTAGVTSGSEFSTGSCVQRSKKINIYNQMAQVLVGYDVSGSIEKFDRNGSAAPSGVKLNSCLFINFARLLSKDEVKKNSFRFGWFPTNVGGFATLPATRAGLQTIGDYSADTNYLTNSPAGEYALLYTSSVGITSVSPVGHIYYQAGIVVLTASIIQSHAPTTNAASVPVTSHAITSSQANIFRSGTINEIANAVRYAFFNVDFNNTTELNSSIYFCRANNTEFNYSSNATYLSASEIRVKGQNPLADPVSYITTVGLYSPDNELLAVAKLSEPLKKSPSNEITLRVRLDY